ncbi:hypothetical protein [Natrinema caseinilyticum]|uniref:hypothetical protein n=1 Tax=Natrinema caseinilyticum TaxID=2961570 RepID=UPI0020C55E95|nr:hypothetical protein [Natrinema caseinilyticum]
MKKGTGSDPFADIQDEDREETRETEDPTDERVDDEPDSEPEQTTETETPPTDGPSNAGDSGAENGSSTRDSIIGEPPQNGANDAGVPWVYVRDNVKQDREMVQFYLRDYVVDAEDEFVDAVSEELGTDVSKTDVREAAYEAAMYNVDEVVDRLRAWGFESVD